MSALVLVVDDDATIRRPLADRLEHWGYRVREATSGSEAITEARRIEPDVVLLDLAMPGLSGMDVLRVLREEGVGADVVVLTAHGSVDAAVQALKAGAADFLQKPTDFEVLRAVLARLATGRRKDRAARAMVDRIGDPEDAVFGGSPSMQKLLALATRAAQSDATLLLDGESGSGKQVLAEWVHAKSPRREGPFVHVNCVALSDDLAESALFGHEKGAFTGAVARKQGRLEMATGGTALLDEIGDTTPRFQTKLLHFLDSGQYERVGGTQTLTADCRILAATNRDLQKEVDAGRFRGDLFYRLNVVRLTVPPLRERTDDILPLAAAFVSRFAREAKRPPLTLPARTLQALEKYRWPGNVRQLRNVIERAVVLAPGPSLTPDLLPPELFDSPGDSAPIPQELPLKHALAAFRRSYVARTLTRYGGNQTRAAEALGVHRTFLNRLVHRLGLASQAPADGRTEPGTIPPRW